MPHLLFIIFVFALGACVGSFLNVVVWRLPRNESLVTPPSHCPKCNHRLAWFDNLPIVGWIFLGGKCRYCRAPISPKYPIIEFLTAALFAFYYAMFFIYQVGPCATREMSIQTDWPMYALYMFLIASLLAASLIDAELFIIPIEIPWLCAIVGIIVHTIVDSSDLPGALRVNSGTAALSAGGGIGLLISIAMWYFGKIPTSFPEGEPILEVERAEMEAEIEQAKREGKTLEYESHIPPPYTSKQIRAEMRKEMFFLLPPMVLAILWWYLTSRTFLQTSWSASVMTHDWLNGLLGAIFGGLVGGFVVWVTRILGTLGFGRVAMGLGDVHLMLGVGAIIGAGAAGVAFFVAPFFGILIAIWMLVSGKRRELPYGPYLSLATAAMLLFYCPIAAYLRPGFEGLRLFLTGG